MPFQVTYFQLWVYYHTFLFIKTRQGETRVEKEEDEKKPKSDLN